MENDKYWYINPEELFRVGNSNGPRFVHVRSDEVDTYPLNGVTMIQANNRGISLYTDEEFRKQPITGWVWRLSKGAPLPQGLRLCSDKPGHYMIVPAFEMPADMYKGLLGSMVCHAAKIWKKSA
ncbi:MAG: hypothetical protein IPP19_08030 [Verrucomicrobia bacterium]|nr:hypothetical protein [Verrucomicrobiota bacterium]